MIASSTTLQCVVVKAALGLGLLELGSSLAIAQLLEYAISVCPAVFRVNHLSDAAQITSRTEHLKGVKIAIMGCIVNGPGEMADADFGYVGGAPGKINLYVGKTAVKFNIPEAEAVDCLVDLIKEHGKWAEPEPQG